MPVPVYGHGPDVLAVASFARGMLAECWYRIFSRHPLPGYAADKLLVARAGFQDEGSVKQALAAQLTSQLKACEVRVAGGGGASTRC
jgi:hypothetical protein